MATGLICRRRKVRVVARTARPHEDYIYGREELSVDRRIEIIKDELQVLRLLLILLNFGISTLRERPLRCASQKLDASAKILFTDKPLMLPPPIALQAIRLKG
jgi:hypothetical protein